MRIQVTCDVTFSSFARRLQSYEGSDVFTFCQYLALNLIRQELLAERNCFTSHRVELATTLLLPSKISERNVLSLTVRAEGECKAWGIWSCCLKWDDFTNP